ncbi:MAG: protein kinase [Acidobacteria bacterium]|nr:protein kinase [Acidobacteriota bacterium]
MESGEKEQIQQRLALFKEGDMVAERYRIVRYINHGAMGVVYEAVDVELNEHIALKTIRIESAHNPKYVERFKREIQLARRVTHPNVCRIFDVGFHVVPPNPGLTWFGGEVTFLTMELLNGQSLNDYVDEKGRLSADEAQDMMRQIADAVSAAHQAGVIHGDLKSDNVLLVSDEHQLRPVVTDFGLAKTIQHDGHFFTTVGGMDHFVGTPAFMAPEQVEGGGLDRSTDVYALGCIYYQLLTGRVPFIGETLIQTALARLVQDPTPPRRLEKSIPKPINRIILKCLRRNQGDRYPDASAFLAALENPNQERSRWPWLLPAGVLIVLVFAVVFMRLPKPKIPVGLDPLDILVLSSFHDDPDLNLEQELTQRLSAIEGVHVLPREKLDRAIVEIGIQPGDDPSVEFQRLLCDQLQADWCLNAFIVLQEEGQRVLLTMNGFDRQKGRRSFAFERSEESPSQAIEQAVAAFSGSLNRPLVAIEVPPAESYLKHIDKGRQLLWTMDFSNAQSELRQATDIEPSTESWLWLSMAEASLGHRDPAQKAWNQALASTRTRSEKEKLYRDLDEFQSLLQSYQLLFRDAPNAPHADALTILGDMKPKPASQPRPVETPTRELLIADARVAEAEGLSGEQTDAKSLFERGLRGYVSVGDRHGEARTRHNLGVLLADRGDFEGSLAYLQEAVAIWDDLKQTESALQSRWALLRTMINVNDTSSKKMAGDLAKRAAGEGAWNLVGEAEQILANFDEADDKQEGEWGHLTAAISAFSKAGLAARACQLELRRQRLAFVGDRNPDLSLVDDCVFERSRDRADLALLRSIVAFDEGRLDESAVLVKGLETYRSGWRPKEQAVASLVWGRAALNQGDVQRARLEWEQCLRLSREIDNNQLVTYVLRELAPLYFDMGLYALARHTIQELLQIGGDQSAQWQEKFGDVQYQEAGLLRSSGQMDQTIERYRDAIESYQQCGAARKQAVTRELLADTLVSQDELEQGLAQLTAALELWIESDDLSRQAVTLRKMAAIFQSQSLFRETISLLKRSARVYEQLQDPTSERTVWTEILKLADQANDTESKRDANKRLRTLQSL